MLSFKALNANPHFQSSVNPNIICHPDSQISINRVQKLSNILSLLYKTIFIFLFIAVSIEKQDAFQNTSLGSLSCIMKQSQSTRT